MGDVVHLHPLSTDDEYCITKVRACATCDKYNVMTGSVTVQYTAQRIGFAVVTASTPVGRRHSYMHIQCSSTVFQLKIASGTA